MTNTPITNFSPAQALEPLTLFQVIEVRRSGEFNKKQQYLFVCRSGRRSSRAAQSLGFQQIFNLDGSMLT